MKKLFLNSSEDMRWLFSTHLNHVSKSACFQSAIVYGNEDYPDMVELYQTKQPSLGDIPIAIFKANNEGNLVKA